MLPITKVSTIRLPLYSLVFSIYRQGILVTSYLYFLVGLIDIDFEFPLLEPFKNRNAVTYY